MYGHLVAVKVGVERVTNKRVQPDGLSFDQHRLESLNTQAVQRRRAVKHNRMFAHNFVQNGKYFARFFFDKGFRFFNIEHDVLIDQFFHNKGLEQFKRHFRRQTALPQLQFGSDADNRTAGIVDALTEQVLPEASLFSFKHVGNRFKRAVRSAFYDAFAL